MHSNIDFIWSSKKDYNAIMPLYNYFSKHSRLKYRIIKIHKNKYLNKIKNLKISHYTIISHSHAYYRLKNYGWDGEFFYVDHGISPIKYYSYIYSFFYHASILFYPGYIFKEKMDAIHNEKYKKGLLGGYPLIDDLLKTKIDKHLLINKYNLNPNKPIILYAPTWGSKKNKSWGLHNQKYLSKIENLITIPHTADYTASKLFKNITIPKNRQELNDILHLSDIVISDISSIILEATIIKKNTIQLILNDYPGTFPNIDINDKYIHLDKSIIINEINNADLSKRPFKISFLDKDMIVDFKSTPKNIQKTIDDIIKNPNKNHQSREYWSKLCCWKYDGKTNERIYKMILNYVNNKTRKQFN
tara:strand:+ start:1185 stop:2261 length:1077 start_codon:yes stop_codon:yes gene_type:complete